MSDARLHDREVLRAHRIAVNAFVDRAGAAVDAALGKLQQARAEAQRSADRWTQRLGEAEHDVQLAERDLDACLAEEEASCNSEYRALESAQRWQGECDRNLERARRSLGQLDQATQRLIGEAQRFRQTLARDCAAAAAFLGSLTAAADGYVESSIGGRAGGGRAGGGVGGGGGSAPAGPGPQAAPKPPSIGETGLFDAPLDRIDTSDANISGPESFRGSAPYATLRNGVQRLDEVVLPAVRRGAGSEYFVRMDRRLGLDYEHGYQRVYDAFFGGDSLLLDARPDGGFGVTSGQHRIYVARELGLSSLPARIRWPRSGR